MVFECKCLLKVRNVQLCYVFAYKQALSFLDASNGPISGLCTFGLSPLISEIYGESANSGLCAFGVLHVAQPTEAEQQVAEDYKMTKIEVVSKSLPSFVWKNV